MKKIFLISACLGLALGGFAQEYDDDIYYNPKTAKTKTTKADKKTMPTGATVIGGDTQTYYYYPQSAYQETRDVDEYNRHGGYYQTPIDTIGQGMANSQDFVYTQEIQKYYNPTIVVDNLAVLSDVLDNSYGNVNIVYDYGYPTFTPWYSWTSPWYRTTWCWDPYWNWNWGWGPSWAWGYAPGWSWSWGWGGWYDPWYAWGPSWSWGWGPGWGWGGTWRPSTPRPGNNPEPGLGQQYTSRYRFSPAARRGDRPGWPHGHPSRHVCLGHKFPPRHGQRRIQRPPSAQCHGRSVSGYRHPSLHEPRRLEPSSFLRLRHHASGHDHTT